jgi:alkane 1-monooxygenase
MNVSMVVPKPDDAGTLSALRSSFLHLGAFVLPVLNLVFLITGPHEWQVALLWFLPIWVLVLIDVLSRGDLRQPELSTPAWPFDLQVGLLVALQIANHVLLGVMASDLALWPSEELGKTAANFVATQAMSGVTAGYSGIVLGHELVHRRNRIAYFFGRVLLMFVCYEHFATEHVRGHHPRLGTGSDPATARFGETFREFFWRTVPQQFQSAWRLESTRLGDPKMKLKDPRMLRHRVLQGVVAEVGITLAFLYFFGFVAMLFFLLQARMAIMLLEVVNYIEHWGIQRTTRSVTTVDSWDTDNWFTLYTLVGLSRHSDHHARASRPYHLLQRFEDSPKMPSGYYGTIVMALFTNERYRKYAAAELERKGLGPFGQGRAASTARVDDAGPAADAAAPSAA